MIVNRRNGIVVLRDILARHRAALGNVDGSVATEYGLIAAFVVAAVIVALTNVREGLLGLPFESLIAAFTGAMP